MTPCPSSPSSKVLPGWLALFAALAFGLFLFSSYGGVRSPDSEIVFRTALSLASGDGFAVSQDLENWPGFGLAPGRDGARYAVFGPLESVLLVPVVWIAEGLETFLSGWPESVPPSHYTAKGLSSVLSGAPVSETTPHRIRFFASWFNPALTALMLLVFGLLACRLFRHRFTQVALVFGLGFSTLAWSYSGTFFSEPLATLLALLSFSVLIYPDTPSRRATLRAGIWLGLAVTAHLSALLFAPFWALLAFWPDTPETQTNATPRRGLTLGAFLLGLGLLLLVLGSFNYLRFGDFLETGRSVDPAAARAFGYGQAVLPWEGLGGLLTSAGKGLWLFAPLSLLAALAWPSLHRARPRLSWVLLAMLAARFVFVASRSDWHAGFSLGPRYLVMALPYLVLPLGFWLDALLERRQRARAGTLFGVLLVAAIQQAYFAAGEIFSYFHMIRVALTGQGADPFAGDRIYRDVMLSPLWRLHEGLAGPFWAAETSPLAAWTLLTVLVLALGLAFGLWACRRTRETSPRA